MINVTEAQKLLDATFRENGTLLKDALGISGLLETATPGGESKRCLLIALQPSEVTDLICLFGQEDGISLEGADSVDLMLGYNPMTEDMQLSVDIMYPDRGVMLTIPMSRDESKQMMDTYLKVIRLSKEACTKPQTNGV